MLPKLCCGVGCVIYLGGVRRRMGMCLLGESRQEGELANSEFAALPEKKLRQAVPLGSRSPP